MPESKVTYCRTNRISSHHLFHKTTLTDFLPSQDIHPSQRKQEVTNPPCFRPVPFLAQWPCLVSPKNRGSEKKKKKKNTDPLFAFTVFRLRGSTFFLSSCILIFFSGSELLACPWLRGNEGGR